MKAKVTSIKEADVPSQDFPEKQPDPRRRDNRLIPDHKRKELEDSQLSLGIVPLGPIDILDVAPNRVNSKPPEPMMLRPTELHVDRRYQRGHLSRRSTNLISKIVSNWDWTKFKPPVVTKDTEGRYLVIDGQHTSVAASMHPDIDRIPVMFVPIHEVEEQAQAFIGHNMDRVSVGSIDLFYAKIAAKDRAALEALRILNLNNISIVRTWKMGEQVELNQTMATSEVMAILERWGPPKFAQIADFIAKCGFRQIRVDHWKMAAHYLTDKDKVLRFSPERMLDVIQATSETDALLQARQIASGTGAPVYVGLLSYYQRKYQQAYNIS